MKLKIILTILGIFLIVSLGTVFALNPFIINNSGSIKTSLGVECNIASISWGSLDPSQVVTKLVKVRASGTSPITLTITYGNWQPSTVSTYLTCTSNYTGQSITNQWKTIAFTLTVASNVYGFTNFSFDITLTAN